MSNTLFRSTKKRLNLSLNKFLKNLSFKSEDCKILEEFISLIVVILRADGQESETEKEHIVELLKNNYGDRVEKIFEAKLKTEVTLQNINFDTLKSSELATRVTFLETLCSIAFSDDDYCSQEKSCLQEVCQKLDVPQETLAEIEAQALEDCQERQARLQSGTGLIAALFILALFILTATLLKSVFFGLVLSYFFLPLQKVIARSFLNNGIFAKLVASCKTLCCPITKPISVIREKFMKHFPYSKKKKELSEEEKKEKIISQTCYLTVGIVCLLGTAFFVIGLFATLDYADKKIEENKQEQVFETTIPNTPVGETEPTAELSFTERQIEKLEKYLSKHQETITKIPGLASLLESIQEKLTEENIKNAILSKKEDILSSTGSLLGTIIAFLLDLLLTIFFFSFFLEKIALFTRKDDQGADAAYLVESIFETSWIPSTSKDTRETAIEIINVIFEKLKVWVKGYLWIIIIESTIYISLFFMLDVPYAFVLGLIAGHTVLLPFLGPMASLVLTLLVCLAMGTTSMTTLLSIAILYFIMNMIIEQLFLYPAFVGEALGLNILETLIVVLLGGVFAGLAGVIFAVPVTSVLKYLIPRTYAVIKSKEQNSKLELLS